MERWRPAHISTRHSGAALSLRHDAWLRRSERGAMLVELLASMVLVSILTAMAYGFARAALVNARVQDVKSEVQEAAVLAADTLERELRLAGFSAAAQSLTGILLATPESVEIASDLNGDGDTNDAHERIAYRYDAQGGQVTRATSGGSPQPFVTGVPSGGFRFVFYDTSGAQIAAGASGLSAADRRRVGAIGFALRLELRNPSPQLTLPLAAALSGYVYLRNR